MAKDFYIYNSLSRQKELFKPICPGMVGLYVCGPTVYGEAHLGHARPGITFDILVRWLRYSGYKVRYVRNVTDVGHLENDADEGEDKIAKKARLEALEPMEIVQTYTEAYHDAMRALNVAPPSIEPRASGHIIEQIATVQKILDAGFAYVSNGSVYFDVAAYDKKYKYGILSGRDLENTRENTRSLDGQDDKRSPLDFALWKKASPEHIMKWPSPWSEGFPGWHLECSTMSEKYLGTTFDIHGGGIDLKFPHHECELAQNTASRGTGGVRYWMHNNMITINGQKMGKSLGNFITLKELFSGSHKALEQAYSPMTIRFFILQAHYRSTLDFSNDALQAAGKGYKKLMQAANDFKTVKFSEKSEGNTELQKDYDGILDSLNDDLNTPVALSFIFDAVRIQNQAKDGQISLDDTDRTRLEEIWTKIVPEVLGLTDESAAGAGSQSVISGLMEMLLDVRKNARAAKDWPTCDMIRDRLNALGVKVKDTKDGTEWSL